MQMTVLTISLIVMAILAWTFIAAVRAAGSGDVSPKVESRRNQLIAVLAVIGVIISVVSLRPWPHAVSAAPAAVVNVSGGQWYWEIDTDTVPLRQPVAFNVHTVDVTHGFGVMNEAGQILFQTQAIPGYVNRVDYTFDTPGTYRVACLEYCGVGHTDMRDEFTVAAE